MQKQPKYAFSFCQIDMNPEFPFRVSDLYTETDRAITKLHIHDTLELGYCYEGAGIFVVGNKILPFKAGDVTVITSKECHLARSLTGTVSKWRWIYLNLEKIIYPVFNDSALCDFSRFQGLNFNNVISSEQYPVICELVCKIVAAGIGTMRFQQERIVAMLCLFAAEIHAAFDALPHENSLDESSPGTIQRLNAALEYMIRKYQEPLRVEKLAWLCRLSQTHFRRLFREAVGKSPIQYLNQIRIGMAKAELDRNRRPVGEIAFECGFESVSSFNRQFKAQTGHSPREWRNKFI
jgi:AraC-like DNA-binding protein